MTLHVVKTPAVFHAVLASDGSITLFEPAQAGTQVIAAPSDVLDGVLDYSAPGDPLSEVI